jgi:DNA-directed RNA polymerase beta subunit
VVTLLRAFGFKTNEDILATFQTDKGRAYMKKLLETDEIKTQAEAYVEVVQKSS